MHPDELPASTSASPGLEGADARIAAVPWGGFCARNRRFRPPFAVYRLNVCPNFRGIWTFPRCVFCSRKILLRDRCIISRASGWLGFHARAEHFLNLSVVAGAVFVVGAV